MSARPTWVAIVNPAAAGGRGPRRLARWLEAIVRVGARVDVHALPREAGPDATEAAARTLAAEGRTHFLAAGGDGTVNAIVNGLRTAGRLDDCVLGALPLGGGNDWLRNRGLPRDVDALAALLADPVLAPCPIGVVRTLCGDERCFVNAAGVGLDVRVIEQAPAWSSATVRYGVGLVRAFARYAAPVLRWRVDGTDEERRLLLAMCALGPCSGGGMRLAPHATALREGFAVTAVDDLPWWRLLVSGYRLYDGTLGERPEVRLTFGAHIEFLAPTGEPVQADGDVVARTPVSVSRLATSLRGLHVRDQVLDPGSLPRCPGAARSSSSAFWHWSGTGARVRIQ